jgi:hypothetical protein
MMRQTQPTSAIGGYEDINMKIKIYVLSTVLADENGPAMPAVFADESEARAKYDEVMCWEWDSIERIRRAHGAEWSRWELTRHDIEISTTN